MKRVFRAGVRVSNAVVRACRSPNELCKRYEVVSRVYKQSGIKGVYKTIEHALAKTIEHGDRSYSRWIKNYDMLDADALDLMKRRLAEIRCKPLISLLMPVYNTPENLLIDAIESVRAQVYPNWELCVADDASTQPHVREVLERYRYEDARISVIYREKNGHISRSTNTALESARGEWIGLLDHDDMLRPESLSEVVLALDRAPHAKLVYTDEDKLDEEGQRCEPYFKPDWNYELFLSYNLITHFAAFRADLVRQIGGFRVGFEGAQDYDLALRIVEQCKPSEILHIPKILYHWRKVEGSTALSGDEKPYAMLAGERALNEHLQRVGKRGSARLIGVGYKVTYDLPNPEPLVSIIIPTKDRLDILEKCVASIWKNTNYKRWEVLIVDNASVGADTKAYLSDIAQNPQFKVLEDLGDFNYSRSNNLAAKQANGDFLLLLNNDVEAITPGWLREMVGVCSQDDVGAVGARLWYPNDTLQHGGVILGLGGLAAHAHTGIHKGMPGYVGRAILRHELSAVSAACMLTRREVYESVGGLDEVDLKVAYNDVDYCLKLRSAGWKIVWTPFADLYHYESASRGYERSQAKQDRLEKEKIVIRKRWQSWLDRDPAYNPNLSLDDDRFSLGFPPRV